MLHVATACWSWNLHFHPSFPVPNPPGPIEILMKTVSSIEIRWKEAPLMTNASFKYLLSNISSQGVKYIASTTATHNFTSLRSGTSYNISVATVGAMDFQSKKVKFYSVTTSKGFISVPQKCACIWSFLFCHYYLVTFTSLISQSNNQDHSVQTTSVLWQERRASRSSGPDLTNTRKTIVSMWHQRGPVS